MRINKKIETSNFNPYGRKASYSLVLHCYLNEVELLSLMAFGDFILLALCL